MRSPTFASRAIVRFTKKQQLPTKIKIYCTYFRTKHFSISLDLSNRLPSEISIDCPINNIHNQNRIKIIKERKSTVLSLTAPGKKKEEKETKTKHTSPHQLKAPFISSSPHCDEGAIKLTQGVKAVTNAQSRAAFLLRVFVPPINKNHVN